MTAILPGMAGPPGTAASVAVAALAGAADQIKIVCKSGTQKHTEERYRAVGGTLPCKDQLTQRAATGQYRCKTDNVHAKDVPQMLRMCNGLAGEAQMEIAGGNVINGHDRKQRGNNAEQVEILHQDHIADASGKVHTAFLCEGTDDQCDHQCQQQRSVLAAGPSVLAA